MRFWSVVILLVASLAASGCLSSEPTDDVVVEAAPVDPCEDEKAKVEQTMEARMEDLFGERPNVPAGLMDCSRAGAFRLAAYGLSGKEMVSLAFDFPNATVCQGWFGKSYSGGHSRSGMHVYERPDGSRSISSGGGGGGMIVSAYVTDYNTNDLTSPGGGSTGTGSMLRDWEMEAGQHRFTFGADSWGSGMVGFLSDGAPLLVELACEDPFRLAAVETADLFWFGSDQRNEAGAGARAFLVGGASGGILLEGELPEGGQLAAVGFAFTGATALVVEDADGMEPHPGLPLFGARVARDVPAGPIRVSGGQIDGSVAAMAFGPFVPLNVAELVGA